MENKLSFSEAIARATATSVSSGIGTLGEKTLHRTLKFYFEPDESNHEKEYLGSVVDILNKDGIIEIQTRAFNKLVPKLEAFLPKGRVTVVYPIIEGKYICRFNSETGESMPPRKSAKRGKAWDALPEIACIRRFLPNDNLTVLLVLVDAVETRLLQGKVKVGRKRTEKVDCIPTSINSIVRLDKAEDYLAILPDNLTDEFTKADYERITRQKGIDSHSSLMLLLKLGIVSRDKRDGRAYIYTINK